MPAVSVIIPAYNQGEYLKRAIQSVLEQTFSDFEVIVVDDGSTDSTPDVVKEFTDPRIHYIRQENRGLSGARNTGIRNACGCYLSFLDSDDLFLPQKLALLTTAFEQQPGIGMAAGQAVLIDEKDQPLEKTFKSHMPCDCAELLLGNPFHVGSVLLLKSWQEKVGFFDESLRSYEDWDMWLRLAKAGCQMITIDQPVSLYRFHTAQMTRNGAQMTRASFAVLEKTYQDPDLPARWHQVRDLAYANAHIRAAAHGYLAHDYDLGQSHLQTAVNLNPVFLQDVQSLANRLSGLTELPKTSDPLQFLEDIYDHLPPSLDQLYKRRNQDLGRSAVNLAFKDFHSGQYLLARKRLLKAIQYRPNYLFNRGVLSVLLKSLFLFNRSTGGDSVESKLRTTH